MELTADLANRIVDFIYKQSGYHSIVCDKNGCIIADSARARLGVIHGGSKRIMTSDEDTAVVTKEEAEQSGGHMKEGFSLAIKLNNEKVGTFGIAGPLAIITPIAKVAAGMVETTFRDEEIKGHMRLQVHRLNTSIEQAAAAIREMVTSSQEVSAIAMAVADEAEKSHEQVKATEEILNFIRRVANQTNLLGINAAIEAARAGSMGEVFQVVAGEVRKLAEDSSRSANDIQALLQKFRDTIETVTAGVRESGKINLEQATHTQEIAKMVEGVKEVGDYLSKLADQL